MAQNFDYTRSWLSEADFPLLGFSRNWENPSDYPTVETDEGQVRRDMQSLHDEVKDYLNTVLIPKVIAEETAIDAFYKLVGNLAVVATTLPAGATATASIAVDPATGGYKMTLGIPRGEDGDGAGDMTKFVYDTEGKQTDVFKYVDDAIANLPPAPTYGTEDLEAGVTPLENGQLHFVYEL